MARVFISHAGVDRELADQVLGWLAGDGHEGFLDGDLRAGLAVGEQWQPRLYERLRWADAVVCLITAAFVTSAWCAAEVGIADARGSRLLPLPAAPGLSHPRISADVYQYAELSDLGGGRALLSYALARLDVAGGRGWPDGRSPFPGLRAFDADRHRVFFGRGGEGQELVGLLPSPAARADGGMIVVVGPSGCGKSSLVRAGVLPVMAGEPGWWPRPPVQPGADPVGALARELTAAARRLGQNWNLPQVRHRLTGDDHA